MERMSGFIGWYLVRDDIPCTNSAKIGAINNSAIEISAAIETSASEYVASSSPPKKRGDDDNTNAGTASSSR